MTAPSTDGRRQVDRFAAAVFQPDDLVEVRLLPSGKRTWHRAADLAGQYEHLRRANAGSPPQNVYLGANPRRRKGGSSAEDVLLARCLFVDFDGGTTPQQAQARCSAAGLPEPTVVVSSGHGTHCYWRLAESMTDLAEWTRLQRALIAAVGGDPAIHDPPRIMRLPGFDNVKAEPFVPCQLDSCHADEKFDLDTFQQALVRWLDGAREVPAHEHKGQHNADLGNYAKAAAYIAKVPGVGEGQRNDTAFRLAAALVKDFCLPEADALALLLRWNAANSPPLDESELRSVMASAKAHAKRAPGSKATSGAAGDGPQPWPELLPFGEEELPPFPSHALPDELRLWVEQDSHATQTPADLAGLLALGICAATIARRVEVEARQGFREPVNLYVAVLLEPGNRKSAVFSDAAKPFRELEAELIESERPVVARAQSARRQDEARLKKLEKSAAEKNDPEAAHQAESLAAELAERPEPVLPRLIVDDATAEKLAMVLDDQGGRIASMSAEGGVFDLMAGRYSKNGAPQFEVYLKGHSGDDLVSDRVSRKSVRVEKPAITCAYAIQPAVVAGLAKEPAFRGRGLLARFLYAVPRSWIGSREVAAAPVLVATRTAYHQVVRRLSCEDFEVGSGLIVLSLSPEASAEFQSWEAEVESMLADGGVMEFFRDWGAKLAGETLRVAAVLHCIEYGREGSIGRATIAAAVEIARYLIPHAEAALGLMFAGNGNDADSLYVLRWILREGKPEFSKRDAHQHGRKRFPRADDVDPALAELVRRGYIRPRRMETTGPGRRPSPVYEVNPAAFENETAEMGTQNPHNSTNESRDGNSEDIEDSSGASEITDDLLEDANNTFAEAATDDEWGYI